MEQVGQGSAFGRRVSYIAYNYEEELKHITTNKKKVLEIGPGRGELLSILNDRGIENIDILDNDKAVLSYCKKEYRIGRAIHAADLDMKKYIKEKYDLIILTQVFEHIPKSSYINWITVLYKSLQSGGKIVITSPNGANPFVGTERYGDLQHENMFTVYSYQELMTFASLKGAEYSIRGFEIPPTGIVNIVRIVLQKMLHGVLIGMMIVNGAIYQTLMTPNITLVITKNEGI